MVNDAVIPMAAVGIQYFAGPVVTILASKTSRKYTQFLRPSLNFFPDSKFTAASVLFITALM